MAAARVRWASEVTMLRAAWRALSSVRTQAVTQAPAFGLLGRGSARLPSDPWGLQPQSEELGSGQAGVGSGVRRERRIPGNRDRGEEQGRRREKVVAGEEMRRGRGDLGRGLEEKWGESSARLRTDPGGKEHEGRRKKSGLSSLR